MTGPGPGLPVAVVDVGSNSVRLLLCDGADAAGPTGPRFTTVTGLRRGADVDGAIAPEALDRLDACLEAYGRRMRDAGVTAGVVLGTSAARDAPNRAAVADRVAQRLGLPLTVLSGAEEAALAFAGARLAAPRGGTVLVLDVGGGSTELVRGDARVLGAVSLQVGAVRCTEGFLYGDPPTAAQIDALRRSVGPALAGAVDAVGGRAPMIGVAGTVTTLAAIRAGRYDPAVVHGSELTRDEVEGMLDRLAVLPLHARREVPGLDPARAPVIVAGAAIVACAMEAAGAARLEVSERDLLDGAAMAAGRIASPVDPDPPPGERLRDGLPGPG
ncbi:MAG: Ppx/GppA family phosphatase [Thermoleophilia bacterium]|nr:Ppx/GppA family phosphatase [Thermoleophilia bacterium]